MKVETGGTGKDVMQSSESLGMPPNTLNTDASIKQGVKYFSELLHQAEQLSCDTNTAIQSYNFGGGFIHYVSNHGKAYTYELAEQFSKEKAGGQKVAYTNPIASSTDGSWRYAYAINSMLN